MKKQEKGRTYDWRHRNDLTCLDPVMSVNQQYNYIDMRWLCKRRVYPTNYRTDCIVQRLREHSSFSLMIKNCHGVALFIVWTKHNDENKSITKRIGKFWMIFFLSKQRDKREYISVKAWGTLRIGSHHKIFFAVQCCEYPGSKGKSIFLWKTSSMGN